MTELGLLSWVCLLLRVIVRGEMLGCTRSAPRLVRFKQLPMGELRLQQPLLVAVAPDEAGALGALRRLGVGVFELYLGQRLPTLPGTADRVALEALRQRVAELVEGELVPGLLLAARSLATERPLVLAVVALGRVRLPGMSVDVGGQKHNC